MRALAAPFLATALLTTAACGNARAQIAEDEVRVAYFEVDDALFGLEACHDLQTQQRKDAARGDLNASEMLISRRLGRESLDDLKRESAERYQTIMIEQCAGEAGLARLDAALDQLSSALME